MFNNNKQKQKPNITFYILDDAFSVKHSIYTVLTNPSVVRNMEANFYPIGEGILYEELFDKLNENKADLYFLDTELEDGTGWDLVPVIKEKYPDAFIVMLSDGLNPSLNAKREQYESMIFSTIEKPFQPGIVIGVLDELISYQNSRKELSEGVTKEKRNKKKTAADKLLATTITPVATPKKKKKTFSGFTIGGKLPELAPSNTSQPSENDKLSFNDSFILGEEKQEWTEPSIFDIEKEDDILDLTLDFESEDDIDNNSFTLINDDNDSFSLAQSDELTSFNNENENDEDEIVTPITECHEEFTITDTNSTFENLGEEVETLNFIDEVIDFKSDAHLHLEEEAATKLIPRNDLFESNDIKYIENDENNINYDEKILFIDGEITFSDVLTPNKDDFKVNYNGNGSIFDYNDIKNEFSKTINDDKNSTIIKEHHCNTTNEFEKLISDDYIDFYDDNLMIIDGEVINNEGKELENSDEIAQNSDFTLKNKENQYFEPDFNDFTQTSDDDVIHFSNSEEDIFSFTPEEDFDEEDTILFFEDEESTSAQEGAFNFYDNNKESSLISLEEDNAQSNDALTFEFDDKKGDETLSLDDSDNDMLYFFEDEQDESHALNPEEGEKIKTPLTENFDLELNLLENDEEDGSYQTQNCHDETLLFFGEDEEGNSFGDNEKLSQTNNFEYSETVHPYSETMDSEHSNELSFSLTDESEYATIDWDSSHEAKNQGEEFYFTDDEDDELEFEDDEDDEFYIRPPMRGW